jgi:hypothetical protein
MDTLTTQVLDPVKDRRWDEFVERHPNGWIYHLSNWCCALQDSFKHIKGHCIVIVDKPGDRIVAGFPLFTISSWLTGKRVVSEPFSTIATPLVSVDEHIPVLLSAALALCKRNRCSRLEIRSMRSYASLLPEGFSEVSRFRHHVIDLSQPIEAIFKKLDRSCVRQRITRAESNNIIIQKGSTQSDLRDFFNLYLITRRRVGRPAQPFRFFRAIWDQCYTQGLCELLFACKDGKRLAGLLLLKYKTRISAEWAASDDAFKHMSPNQFVFWQAIKDAREKGFLIFDFGRTAPSNKGLMDFKNRWGAAESGMFEIFYPAQQFENAETDESSFAKRAMSKICQIAPDFLQEPLGSAIYRHLG